MTDQRWARVKALFQAAVERPAAERDAFLAAEAANDDELRREVESLLASDSTDVSFLDRLPLAASAVLADSHLVPGQVHSHPILSPGHRIGSYEVVGRLGAGGMGEVYRTRDTKLGRDVALKVLPRLFAVDPERLVRFRREAQMLAALNHPNIAAIYGLEESSGVQALVLELVEGPTLADLIARGPMALDQALPIAKQIAEALEAAHEHGIVHRDLKPSNIKVRSDGVVKVLDFGLAKALKPEAASNLPQKELGTEATRDGVILGTAAYMSPEQAKGVALDKRADIWAFGCVLFEMLAGRPPFRGDTVTEVLAAVVRDEPDWVALPRDVPRALQTLLRRCLTKDLRQRLQAIGDARIEIDAFDEVPPAGSEMRGAPRSPSKALTVWGPWMAVAALAAGVGVWEAARPAATQENPLANAQFSRLTDWEGTEGDAEISPDGRFVAFLADREGEFDQRRERSCLVPKDDHPPSWGHATRVPDRGRCRSLLVIRWHAPRLFPHRWRFSVSGRPHWRRCSPDRHQAISAGRVVRPNTNAQPQSGLVTRRPMALLRARILGPFGLDRRDRRLARSTLGRIARATHTSERGGNVPGAAQRAHAALCGTREGRIGPVAVDR